MRKHELHAIVNAALFSGDGWDSFYDSASCADALIELLACFLIAHVIDISSSARGGHSILQFSLLIDVRFVIQSLAMANQIKSGGDLGYGILPDLIGYNIRRAQVTVFQDFAHSLKQVDITPGQFGVLTLIDENSGLNQSRLGEGLGVDRSTVVAVIDRLQERGLVVRMPAPGDRRSYALELSPQGRALLKQAKSLVAEHEKRIGGALTTAEAKTLKSLLGKLTDTR
jgi:DNA-binding MarR family transcriptional regulator